MRNALRQLWWEIRYAVAWCRRWLMGVDQGGVFLTLAFQAGDREDYARFLRAVKKVETLSKWSAATISTAAIHYHLAGRSAEAQALFETAAKKDSDQPLMLRNYAYYLGDAGRFEESLKCFNRSLEQAPNDYVAWAWLGNTYTKMGDLDKARDCYERCVREDPKCHGRVYGGLACVAEGKRDWGEAVRQWREAVRRIPYDEYVWYGLGNALASSGIYGEAVVSLEKSLSLGRSHNADVLYNIAYCHYMQGDDVIAKEFNDRALELSPQNPSAIELKEIIEEVLAAK